MRNKHPDRQYNAPAMRMTLALLRINVKKIRSLLLFRCSSGGMRWAGLFIRAKSQLWCLTTLHLFYFISCGGRQSPSRETHLSGLAPLFSSHLSPGQRACVCPSWPGYRAAAAQQWEECITGQQHDRATLRACSYPEWCRPPGCCVITCCRTVCCQQIIRQGGGLL